MNNAVKIIFAVVALVAVMMPAVFVISKVGGLSEWQGVLPRGITDSLYYYARMHEVTDGYPMIGNPYVYEYRQEYPPAFFLPDLISAIPLFVGIPFTITVLVNVFVWSFVFLTCAYLLLRSLNVTQKWAVLWSIIAYFESYAFMLRPTVMQIIYPLFLLFLFVYVRFLREPFTHKRVVHLAMVSASSFYFYNYLSFIVFLTCASHFVYLCATRQFAELRALIRVGIYTTIFLIPFFIHTFMQMTGDIYHETLTRIGLVQTHLPTIEAFFFGRWIIIGLAIAAVLYFFLYTKDERNDAQIIFWSITGSGLFASLFLNFVTGVEFELAIHIGRFIIPWATLLLGVMIWNWYSVRTRYTNTYSLIAHGTLGFLIVFLSFGMASNLPRAFAFFEFDDRGYKIAELQEYARPLQWLDENSDHKAVVWTNLSIGAYVPLMTRHYLLFHNISALHNISNEELEERYLLWRSLDPEITIESLQSDFGFYAGAGPSKSQPRAENGRVFFCNLVSRVYDPGECPQKVDAITLRGKEYFEELLVHSKRVNEEKVDLLKKYKVEYLIYDKKYDTWNLPPEPDSVLYEDERFIILDVAGLFKK